MTIAFRPHQYEPIPDQFAEQFVLGGWRRIEATMDARTGVTIRWLNAAGRPELEALRGRYMRGDVEALHAARRMDADRRDRINALSVASVTPMDEA